MKSLVVRPRNWDEYGKHVKTDRRDALALVSCLDRYLAGNREAMRVIRVPTEQEEQSRSVTLAATLVLTPLQPQLPIDGGPDGLPRMPQACSRRCGAGFPASLPTVKTCAQLEVFDVIRNDKMRSSTPSEILSDRP